MVRLEESVVASNYVTLMLRQTRLYGIDDAVVLEKTQITHAQIDGGVSSVNGHQFLQMIENVAANVDDSAFPVRYGVNMSVGTHGIMGYALLTSATARDALDLALRFYKTIFSIMTFVEEKQGDESHFILTVDAEKPEQKYYLVEGIFSGMLSVARFVSGFQILPCKMRLSIPKPLHADIYQKLFGITPEFGCERNEIILNQETLSFALPANDPQTQKMAEAQCQQMLEAMEQYCSFPMRIKKMMKNTPDSLPDLMGVAQQMNMHPRTLGRRLSEYNTCYKDLLEEVKMELAIQYLAHPETLIDDIAAKLSYNDTTSFYRAFRRWTGQSPSSYRPKLSASR
jgi:AraC-like DNA-binding protein